MGNGENIGIGKVVRLFQVLFSETQDIQAKKRFPVPLFASFTYARPGPSIKMKPEHAERLLCREFAGQ